MILYSICDTIYIYGSFSFVTNRIPRECQQSTNRVPAQAGLALGRAGQGAPMARPAGAALLLVLCWYSVGIMLVIRWHSVGIRLVFGCGGWW